MNHLGIKVMLNNSITKLIKGKAAVRNSDLVKTKNWLTLAPHKLFVEQT